MIYCNSDNNTITTLNYKTTRAISLIYVLCLFATIVHGHSIDKNGIETVHASNHNRSGTISTASTSSLSFTLTLMAASTCFIKCF
jgi:hypothetical protein